MADEELLRMLADNGGEHTFSRDFLAADPQVAQFDRLVDHARRLEDRNYCEIVKMSPIDYGRPGEHRTSITVRLTPKGHAAIKPTTA